MVIVGLNDKHEGDLTNVTHSFMNAPDEPVKIAGGYTFDDSSEA